MDVLKIAVIVWSLGLGYAGITYGVRLYRASDFLVRRDRLGWASLYVAAGVAACSAGLLVSLLC